MKRSMVSQGKAGSHDSDVAKAPTRFVAKNPTWSAGSRRWDVSGKTASHSVEQGSAAEPFDYDFSRIPLHVQPKLTVNAPGDKYEREADRVADQVMVMTDSSNLEPQNLTVKHQENKEMALQRKCTSCEKEDKVQRKETHRWRDVPHSQVPEATSGQVTREFQNNLRTETGLGEPLSGAARAFFEPRFGRSFGDVRVHKNARAGALSRAIGARAFTHGQHLYFAQGQFDVGSTHGRRLVAHELTHTLQQRSSSPSANPKTMGRSGLLEQSQPLLSTENRQIQRTPWEDVIRGDQLVARTDRAGAVSVMRALQRAHPGLEYRIVARGTNFVVQSRTPESEEQPAEQVWQDVIENDQIVSRTDRAGATTAIRRLRAAHPDETYRIVSRGSNFVVQVQSAGDGTEAAPVRPRVCGRDSTQVAGTHIGRINVDLGNLSGGLTITWSNESAATRALPRTFQICPGAGLCTRCCNERRDSRAGGSLCTPKGSFTVAGKSPRSPRCQLSTASWSHNATFFAANIRSGIAFHAGTGRLRSYPSSHGCVRTTEQGSAIIYDNSNTTTAVVVSGTWRGNRCYVSAGQRRTRLRRRSERCTSTAQVETGPNETMLATVGTMEDPIDGVGPA